MQTLTADKEILGGLSKDLFEQRMPNRSEAFCLFICLDANKFVLLSFFSLTKTIYWQVSTKPLPNGTKSPLPVDIHPPYWYFVRYCSWSLVLIFFKLSDHGMMYAFEFQPLYGDQLLQLNYCISKRKKLQETLLVWIRQLCRQGLQQHKNISSTVQLMIWEEKTPGMRKHHSKLKEFHQQWCLEFQQSKYICF